MNGSTRQRAAVLEFRARSFSTLSSLILLSVTESIRESAWTALVQEATSPETAVGGFRSTRTVASALGAQVGCMVVSARYQAGMECSLQQAWQVPIPSLG